MNFFFLISNCLTSDKVIVSVSSCYTTNHLKTQWYETNKQKKTFIIMFTFLWVNWGGYASSFRFRANQVPMFYGTVTQSNSAQHRSYSTETSELQKSDCFQQCQKYQTAVSSAEAHFKSLLGACLIANTFWASQVNGQA